MGIDTSVNLLQIWTSVLGSLGGDIPKKMRTVQIFYSNISNGLDNYSKVRKD
jgi:hypothetical protein